MQNDCVHMSLADIYKDVSKSMEDKKPALIELLETHIDFETIMPASFYSAFYQRYGHCHTTPAVLYFSISPPTLYNASTHLVGWPPHPQSQSHNQ